MAAVIPSRCGSVPTATSSHSAVMVIIIGIVPEKDIEYWPVTLQAAERQLLLTNRSLAIPEVMLHMDV